MMKVVETSQRPSLDHSEASIVHSAHSPLAEQIRLAERMASAEGPVLILGETGTGKELFARLIHDHSRRAEGPFVAVNCAAIPETLLESELFGHVKGAFTGAVCARRGRFDMARGGTLFLDEIGDMPPSLQPKLLRVLQEMMYEPIGSGTAQRANFRIIAATHCDLQKAVHEGHFRADLFYRLNVLQLNIAPLRARPGDLDTLVDHFIDKHAHSLDIAPPSISEEARALLQQHDWPGNIRELENILYRAVVLAGDQGITAELVRPATDRSRDPGSLYRDGGIQLPVNGLVLTELLQTFERQLIQQALKRTQGNRARAADLLGLNRTTLVEKLRKMQQAA